MQTLDNKVIIYDDVCPLCNAYTGAFVKMGWLDRRAGFAQATPEMLQHLDLDRARHEIPLLDTQTGETLYGLDALFLILGARYPVLRPLFARRFFRAALREFYQIITYNRRIIAGSRAPGQGFDCAPDVNFFYRRLYIGLALAVAFGLGWGRVGGGALESVWFVAFAVLQAGLLLAGLIFSCGRLTFAGHWATVLLLCLLAGSIFPAHPLLWLGSMLLTLFCWRKRWALNF